MGLSERNLFGLGCRMIMTQNFPLPPTGHTPRTNKQNKTTNSSNRATTPAPNRHHDGFANHCYNDNETGDNGAMTPDNIGGASAIHPATATGTASPNTPQPHSKRPTKTPRCSLLHSPKAAQILVQIQQCRYRLAKFANHAAPSSDC